MFPDVPGNRPTTPNEDFCIEIQPYIETLTFTPIGAKVPNRGFPVDTFVVGLHYQQVVSDANTFKPLHIENGMWLLLDKEKGIVARLSTIPHGNSVLAIGTSFELNGNFPIPPTDGLPELADPKKAVGYADPYMTGYQRSSVHPIQSQPITSKYYRPTGAVGNYSFGCIDGNRRRHLQYPVHRAQCGCLIL